MSVFIRLWQSFQPYRRWVYLILFWSLSITNYAQDNTAFKIAFVENRALGTVTRDETIGDSLSNLAASLSNFQIEPISIDLRQRIPYDVDLVVLVRPMEELTSAHIVYLWDYLQEGGNLLLAIDPNGHGGVDTEKGNSGIIRLLDMEYGIRLHDDMLIDPWFDVVPLFDLTRSWGFSFPDALIPHPITAPLIQYELPIRFWGGRSLRIESVNGKSSTRALIYTENAHGEVSPFDLNTNTTNQFDFNIGQDLQGRLFLASISEQNTTGSRIAIIGDSEIFQNGFGQRIKPDTVDVPLYAGSYIFGQRLMQWLLDVPQELWQPLPAGLTLIEMDGRKNDWAALASEVFTFTDEITEDVPPTYNLQSIQIFNNDNFAYLSLETVEHLADDATITLNFDVVGTNKQIRITSGSVYHLDAAENWISIPDAEYAVDEHIEIRLPLRFMGIFPTLTQVCVTDSTAAITDCYDGQIASTQLQSFDPAPVRVQPVPMVFVPDFVIEDIALFDAPDGEFIVVLPGQTQLAILGRNQGGNWIKVSNGRYEGWVETALVRPNARISLIPLIQ